MALTYVCSAPPPRSLQFRQRRYCRTASCDLCCVVRCFALIGAPWAVGAGTKLGRQAKYGLQAVEIHKREIQQLCEVAASTLAKSPGRSRGARKTASQDVGGGDDAPPPPPPPPPPHPTDGGDGGDSGGDGGGSVAAAGYVSDDPGDLWEGVDGSEEEDDDDKVEVNAAPLPQTEPSTGEPDLAMLVGAPRKPGLLAVSTGTPAQVAPSTPPLPSPPPPPPPPLPPASPSKVIAQRYIGFNSISPFLPARFRPRWYRYHRAVPCDLHF